MHSNMSLFLGQHGQRLLYTAVVLVGLAGLFAISQYNFLLFHGLVELFSTAVAWSVFLLAWNTRSISSNDTLLFLGIAYLAVGLIDLAHTLAYKGTGYFPLDLAANYATQLWIAGRALEALSLLLFPFLLSRRIRVWAVLCSFSVLTALLFASIFWWGLFPDCFIEGKGLTPFKIAAEYAICLVLMASICLLMQRRSLMDPEVHRLMIWAMAATIAAELAFTFYVSVYGFSNVLGHFFKIFSFFFVYLALIRGSLTRPYDTLFRQLEQEKRRHQEQQKLLDSIFATTPDLFCLKDVQLVYQFANPAFCEFLGKPLTEIVGKSDGDLFPAEEAESYRQGDRAVMAFGQQDSGDHLVSGSQGKRWLRVTKNPVRDAAGALKGILCSVSDITERKQTEIIMAARLRLLQLAESMTLADLLRATLDEAETLTESQAGFYHFLNEPGKMLTLQAWSTNTADQLCKAEGTGLHYPLDQAGVWVECIRERRPIIHNDYANLPNRKGLPPGHVPIARELVVPVMRSGIIVAILGVGNKPSDYNEQDITAINSLADLAWDIAERKRAEEALALQADLRRRIFNSTSAHMVAVDQNGIILEVNDAWMRFMQSNGGNQQTCGPGANYFRTSSPEAGDTTHAGEAFAGIRQVQQGLLASFEIEYPCDSPEEHRWFLMRVQPVLGRPGLVLIAHHDITERKQAEIALQVSMHQFKTLVDASPSGIWQTDATGANTFVSERWSEITGIPAKEALGAEWLQNVHAEDREMVWSCWMEAVRTATSYRSEFRFFTPEIGTVWVLSIASRTTAGSGDWIGTITDISEERRSREQLRETLLRYELVLEGAAGGIWDWDVAAKKVHYSSRWKELRGYIDKEIGDSEAEWSERIHPDDKPAVMAAVEAHFVGDTPYFEMEYRIVCRDEAVKWILDRGKAFRNAAGEVVRMAGSEVDITARKEMEAALRESEGLFRDVFEQQTAIQLMIDPATGQILRANPAAVHFYGWPKEQLEGMQIEAINTLPATQLKRALAKARSGAAGYFEFCHRRADGTIRDVAVHSSPITTARGVILHSINHDITDRKQAEEQLRLSETKLRQALDAARAGTWEWDVTTGENVWSEELFRLYDLDPEHDQASYENWRRSILPRDRDTVERCVQQAAHTGSDIRIAWRVNTANGGLRWLMSRGQPQLNEQGQAVRYLGTVIDITELKQTEQEMLRIKNLMDEGQKIAHLGTFEYIAATGATVWSDEEYSIYGLDPASPSPAYADLLAKNIHPDDADQLDRVFTAALQNGSVYEDEHRIVRPDGVVRWVSDCAHPYFDEDGNIVRYVGTTLDITEHRQAQQAQDDLQNQYFQAQKMESVGRLAGGVAHDFNNMLSVILGHSGILLEELSPKNPFYAPLQAIFKAAEHSADLTRQLLAFARKQTVIPVMLDLNETVESMLKILRRLIGENIQLVWSPSPNLDKIKIDPSQIDQILANLSVNARDAITDTGTLTIETGSVVIDATGSASLPHVASGRYAVLSVSDTGCGMDEETVAHIFEPFFTTKEQGKGTGLGLATVYGIVQQNLGGINVVSAPGRGTTFNVYLPIAGDPMGNNGQEVAPQSTPRGSGTILVVEDDVQVLDMVGVMLERLGYAVLLAASPEQGILLAREHAHTIDLVITDVIMPGMNGREFTEKLQTFLPGLKYLYMSGYTADIISRHGVLNEGVQFIQKPISQKGLAEKIRALLNHHRYA